jgi:hypothetical protein
MLRKRGETMARRWRRGELNRPQDSQPATEKVLDSPAKSGAFGDFPRDRDRPNTARKGLNNPEKPDRVRSAKKKRQDR